MNSMSSKLQDGSGNVLNPGRLAMGHLHVRALVIPSPLSTTKSTFLEGWLMIVRTLKIISQSKYFHLNKMSKGHQITFLLYIVVYICLYSKFMRITLMYKHFKVMYK